MIACVASILLAGTPLQTVSVRDRYAVPLDGSTELVLGKKPLFSLEASRRGRVLMLRVELLNPTSEDVSVPPLGGVDFWCVAKRKGVKVREFRPYVRSHAFVRNLEKEELVALSPLNALAMRFTVAMPQARAGEVLYIRASQSSYANIDGATKHFLFVTEVVPLPH